MQQDQENEPAREPHSKQFRKMNFICNAIEKGWEVKKRDDKYVFTKKHEGKREVYLDSYLQQFLESNMQLAEM
jgi:hypothetical protein